MVSTLGTTVISVDLRWVILSVMDNGTSSGSMRVSYHALITMAVSLYRHNRGTSCGCVGN